MKTTPSGRRGRTYAMSSASNGRRVRSSSNGRRTRSLQRARSRATLLALLLASLLFSVPGALEASADETAPLSTSVSAPALSVSGSAVRWSPIGLESSYGVAISTGARGSAERVTRYLTIERVPGETQSYTLNLETGETAYVGVSADGGATWSEQEATVFTPEPEPEREPAPEPEPTPEPEPEPEPAPEPPEAESTVPSPPAPVLSVHGNTVSWTAIPGVTSYTLATVLNPTTTRETSYRQVTGTSFTPPVVPGQTVNYGLHARTPVPGPWAQEVSIAYPQSPPPPSEPSNPPSGSFGLPFAKGVVANLQGWGINNLPLIATQMKALGVNWEREDLDWNSVEAQKGVFSWTRFDQIVAAAKAQGITILPIVGYAPSWSSPANAAAYAEFVKAAVARYGPGTSANLQWWELWNEPYFAYAWSGHTPEPEAYARDALAAAQAAKSVAPSVKLLVSADYQGQPQVGGTTSSQTSWINDMFTAAPTLGSWIDGVSVHPYGGDPALPLKEAGGYRDTSGQWAFQRIDTIRNKFLAHNVNVPYWITEEGWSTWNFSEETVAHNYADLFPQIKARPWIRALFPFGLREGTATPVNDQAGYGLLKFGTWQPKACWPVIQAGFKTLG
jgi:polysaccharide biosynthesis protein PslG